MAGILTYEIQDMLPPHYLPAFDLPFILSYSIQPNAKTYPLSIGSVATAAMMTPRLGEIP